MTDTIDNLNSALAELEKEIHFAANSYRDESKSAGEAKARFEIANAGAIIAISETEAKTGEKLTEAIRKAKALKQCEKEYIAYRTSEAVADAGKEKLRALQSQLSSVQSRAKLIQIEMDLDRYRA